MTVDQLIKQLQELSAEGHGSEPVFYVYNNFNCGDTEVVINSAESSAMESRKGYSGIWLS